MRPFKPPSTVAASSNRRLTTRRTAFLSAFLVASILLLLNPPVANAQSEGETEGRSELVQQIERASNESLLWGPYKPNLYFGVAPRIPKSLAAGLLWSRVEDFRTVQENFRHTCEQHEGMAGYGWDEYDPRTGGRQTIHDAGNQIDISTEFVKVPGGEHGGNWGLRVKGVPRADAPDGLKTTVLFYTSLDGLGSLEVPREDGDDEELGREGDVEIQGQSHGLGAYSLKVSKGTGEHPEERHESWKEKPLDRTFVQSVQLPDTALWQVKAVLFAHIKSTVGRYIEKYGEEKMPPPEQIYTLDHQPGMGNMHFVQKVFEGPFEFDVLFSSASAPKPMTSEDLTQELEAATSTFSKRYNELMKPQAPFNKEKYVEFSKSLFSNLVGGIGYFFGDSRVDRSYDSAYDEENEGFWEETADARARNGAELEGPYELFTSIPSRPFFPRGFLWDEGFHLIPIVDWDVDLTLDIIRSWFNLMDEDGWIAREQILGAEARSKVPQEFQVQYPHYANPPTLFFILSAFIEKLKVQAASNDAQQPLVSGEKYTMYLQNHEAALQYLRDLYPLLKRHYFWFRRTQAGDIKSYDREAFSSKEGYRWRGRTPQHILTSGLDDYPRAQPPHPGELHVDLISWVGLMTRNIKDIAAFIGEDDDVSEFTKYETAIVRNIDDLHWSADEKIWCDATIDDYEEHALVCHKGYISLFPFLMGLVTDDEKIGAVLDLLADEEELWSPHGIRSLSKKDELYGTDENYWRSPVWMNINYLAVQQLLETAQSSSKHASRAAKLYGKLRKNLVETVYESWKETGFAWEQYNPDTGKGQRTQHFTGWTSLVVKIMAFPDVGDIKKGSKKGHDEL
ncbi:Glycoside hydrolase family 63 [Neofusicoccum parvum]|uniref:Glycoside hydrolase family 63 n=1 Tax=Neofusicoccum parvum TaxID=310453 RepID=A0ACB5S9T6_9PEZI|nr:Glycoside hydrolase family 63 [Neofusicoccum parvum]